MKAAMLLTLLLTGCVSSGECIPPVTGPIQSVNAEIYVGDAQKKALIRSQSSAAITCDDPKFSEMICMSHADFTDLSNYIQTLRERVRACGGMK